MENIINAKNIETAKNIKTTGDTTNTIITDKTTLGELLSLLSLGEKPSDTPTPKKLRETAGDPIAVSPDPMGMGDGCAVYSNGFAVYDNGSGRTVVWLPYCVSYTYYFVKPKDSEAGLVPEKVTLPDGELETLPWAIAVTLIGDHRLETLLAQRKGDRKQNKTLIRGDNEEGDALESMESREDPLRNAYFWSGGRFGEDPLDAVIREERNREMLEAMTTEQREVFVLYYEYGYTQRKIADMLGISQNAIKCRLQGGLRRIKKYF